MLSKPILIDCHVLTLPGDSPAWAAELRTDLAGEPVHQHWLAGIPGAFGAARALGYSQGTAPFVSFADPDDRITPGTFAALLGALLANPHAPFAWAGEQRVSEALQPLAGPSVWPRGYDPRTHRNHIQHVHGVVLYRRQCVVPLLSRVRRAGLGADHLLSLLVARPDRPMPAARRPIHLPIVGRLWRQHAGNHCKQFSAADRLQVQQLSGITPRHLHGAGQGGV